MSADKPPGLGSLRDRVVLQRRDTVPESEGGHTVVFVPLATVWARVRTLAARQDNAADARVSSISHSVVLRYRTDIRPGDRVVHRGINLAVVSAADMNGRRAYLSCACTQTAITG